MMGDYGVELVNDSMQEFYVHFKGPKDSPYEGGVWKVHVELPEGYPYKSPSVVGTLMLRLKSIGYTTASPLSSFRPTQIRHSS